MNQATLRQRLKNTDEGERLIAVNDVLLEDFGPGVTVQLVQHLPVETSQVVREAIVFTLQQAKQPECFPDLFTLFSSDDAYLRNAAMTIFGACGEMALSFLEQQLISADREVRKLILDACVEVGTPGAVRIIRNALYDPAVNVRITAADYLGRLRDVESTRLLMNMFLEDTEPMFRVSVLESISIMGDLSVCNDVLHQVSTTQFSLTDQTLFLPILLRIAGNCHSTEVLAKLLMHLPSLRLYAEDVILAIQNMGDVENASDAATAPHRYIIMRVLREVAEGRDIREDLRYVALTLLDRMGEDMSTILTENFVTSFMEGDFRTLVYDMAHDPQKTTHV